VNDNCEKEIWKPIEGYEDYSVSNFGRIKSFKGITNSERILKQTKDDFGYFRVGLYINGTQKKSQQPLP